MKTALAILFCSACCAFGQAYTFADPTWLLSLQASNAPAGGGGGGVVLYSNLWSYPILQQQLIKDDYYGWGQNGSAFVGQKIKNTSSTNIVISKLRIGFTPGAGGDALVTAKVRSTLDIDTGIDYGATNISLVLTQGAASGLRDFIWTTNYPVIPANTDFYVGYMQTGNQAAINIGTVAGGTRYQDTNYFISTKYGSGGALYDMVFEIWNFQDPPESPVLNSNLWSYPILQQQTNENNYGGLGIAGLSMAAQKIKNTSSTNVVISKLRINITDSGSRTSVVTARVRSTNVLAYGTDYGATNISITLPSGGTAWRDFIWTNNYPVIPANSDFWVGFTQSTNGAMVRYFEAVDGSAYQGTNYYLTDQYTGIGQADMKFEIWNAVDPPPFHPTNIPNATVFLSYLDLPANSKPDAWTNLLADKNVVFTNMGSTYPTNSSQGVYFPGTTGSYFKTGQTNQYWEMVSNSVWVVLKPISIPGAWANIIGFSASAGWGLYGENSQNGFKLTNTQFGMGMAFNTQYDLALKPMYNWNGVTFLTNGVLALTNGAVGNLARVDKTLWGIGQDADGDQNMNMYIKYFLMCTNYMFTDADIANLHAYSLTH